MATPHFIAVAGLHGCLPNFSACAESYPDAVDSLANLHELGRDRRRALKRDGYLELNLKRDGNEYAEVSECCCSTPTDHADC